LIAVAFQQWAAICFESFNFMTQQNSMQNRLKSQLIADCVVVGVLARAVRTKKLNDRQQHH